MTEWPLTVLALVFLLAYSWEVLARTHVSLCETTINVIWIVFIVDYVVSISLAHDRKTWFKNNLLLLISIMLPIFRPLRLLRLVAVLNVLNRTSGMAVRGRITLYVCSSVILLIYVGSLAELDVERNAPGTTLVVDIGTVVLLYLRSRSGLFGLRLRLLRLLGGGLLGLSRLGGRFLSRFGGCGLRLFTGVRTGIVGNGLRRTGAQHLIHRFLLRLSDPQ